MLLDAPVIHGCKRRYEDDPIPHSQKLAGEGTECEKTAPNHLFVVRALPDGGQPQALP